MFFRRDECTPMTVREEVSAIKRTANCVGKHGIKHRTKPVKIYVLQQTVEILQDNTYSTAEIIADGSYCITVRNNQGYKLPSVGGLGTAPVYFVGSVLTIGGALLFLRKRRRGD